MENVNTKNKIGLLEDLAIESLGVLVAVRDKIPYKSRLKKVVSRIRRVLDEKVES